jgi:nucleotide-binding universal stress UspA family protein
MTFLIQINPLPGAIVRMSRVHGEIDMIKTVLVHLRGSKGDAAALCAAVQIARPFGAHLECLHIRPDWAALVARAAPAGMDDDARAISKMMETVQKDSAESAQRAFDSFTRFCDDERIPRSELPVGSRALGASFREDLGDELDRLIAQTRRHDLVVVKGGKTEDGGMGLDDVGRLVLSAGRPVVLAPTVLARAIRTIAVAWKDAPEAARAVTAAMPILESARRVFVMSAGDDEEPSSDTAGVVTQLQWHGIDAESQRVEPRGRDAHDAVLETAREVDADLLVAGAYGRNRLREVIFGGFTEGLLEDASLPVLLLH